jgi:hypothetical protein
VVRAVQAPRIRIPEESEVWILGNNFLRTAYVLIDGYNMPVVENTSELIRVRCVLPEYLLDADEHRAQVCNRIPRTVVSGECRFSDRCVNTGDVPVVL